MKKGILTAVILAIIIIIFVAVLLWSANKNENNQQKATETIQQQKIEGIQIISPKPNDEISSPLDITGLVNGGGWSGFEGQVGTVLLLDVKGNKIADGVLKATTDWTKPPVQFKSTITFQSEFKGAAILLFSNENPSGLAEKDKKFGLPIIIK